MIDLSSKDLEQLENKGISKEKVANQIETFKEGIPFVDLVKAAVVSNGILRFSDKEQEELVQYFEENRGHLDLLKFVPASGAASRMFKAMFNFWMPLTPKRRPFPNIWTEQAIPMQKSLPTKCISCPFTC